MNCPYCKNAIDSADIFCPKCGGKIPVQQNNVTSLNTYNNSKFSFKAIFIISIITIIAVTLTINFSVNNSSSDAPPKQLTLSEIIASSSKISYDELTRHNENYLNSIVENTGEVIQIINTEHGTSYMIATKNVYNNEYTGDDIIVFGYNNENDRLLVHDIIHVYATNYGLFDYKTVLGVTKSAPLMKVNHLEIVIKAGDR